MASVIQIRRGTAADWTSNNPVLAQGEFGLETDTKKIKIGDGTTNYVTLDYLVPFNLNELLDVSNSNANSDDFIAYDGVNNQWVFRSVQNTDILPLSLLSSGDSIKDSSNNSILSETNGVVTLDNITLGNNIAGGGYLALSSNVYILSLSSDETEINLYTADPGDTVTLSSTDQYVIATNVNFQIQNNNLVMII
jgi:hypothetical protein